MSKAMSEAPGGHKFRVTMVIALLTVLLLLAVVFALQPAPTTGDANPASHARRADGTGGSGITDEPYIERHAEVVARLGNSSLR